MYYSTPQYFVIYLHYLPVQLSCLEYSPLIRKQQHAVFKGESKVN